MYHLVIKYFVLAICLMLAGFAHAYDQAEPADNSNAEWVVVLKDPRPARLQGFQLQGYSQHYSNSLKLKRFGKKIAKEYDLTLKKAWFIDSLSVYCLIVEIDGNAQNTLSSLQDDKRVEWVQPSNSFELLKSSSEKQSIAVSQSSSLLDSSLTKVDGSGIRIAVIDSGVSQRLEDLSDSVSINRDLVVGGEPSSALGERHGTAMVGILVGAPQNSLGLPGVAPAAEVLAYRGCWESANGATECNTLSLARALDNVAKARPSILNLSLSGPRDRLLDRLIDQIVDRNIFVVAAFDPKRPQSDRFPIRRNGVLIVRAEHLHKNHKSEFTAPGTRIVVSPDANYQTMSGHSVATAYTSGVLALLAQNSADKSTFNLDSLVDASGNPQVSNVYQLLELRQ